MLAHAGAADASSRMLTTGSTSQPIGHALFCQQFAAECEVKSKNQAAPKLTKKRWAEILEINNYANRAIKPVTDQDYYGVEEHWTYPRQYGDCEDYALLKRYMLMQRGWPASSLLITVVKQKNGEGHAVLTVRTSNGDFVLDNLETKVKRWDKTAYRFLKRQSSRHSGAWTGISDRRRQVARY
ncbi:MAG: transglutaminase-like cysteine peptidase [Pseudomonadota bacterium]